jgi:hypothetical protein
MMDMGMFANMTPEQKTALMEQMIDVGAMDDEDRLMQEQAAMAAALGNEGPRNWGPGAAAPLGAISDVFGAFVKKHNADKSMDERKALLGKRGKGIGELMGAYFSPQPSPFASPDPVGADGIPYFLRRR